MSPRGFYAMTQLLSQRRPRINHRIRVERHGFDAFTHEPLGKVGVIRRALATDADVFFHAQRGGDGTGKHKFNRRVTLVKVARQQLHT